MVAPDQITITHQDPMSTNYRALCAEMLSGRQEGRDIAGPMNRARAALKVEPEIVPTANYPTSRDYGQLWELAHTAAIVCIVDMDHGKPGTCRDITRTAYSPDYEPKLVQVGSRGSSHVFAFNVVEFIAQCEQCNLEWLVPPAPQCLIARMAAELDRLQPLPAFPPDTPHPLAAEARAWLRQLAGVPAPQAGEVQS